ncbi:MAG: MBL fold metallo-hydrolase [Candidatus Vogelbacteria bacterium]|nr:MBL fold metallo-hydrolase [Candidatus Vogelbacteria bacterium]
MAETKQLKLSFCGGTGGVTGANFLLEDPTVPNGFKALVDCGMFQGTRIEEKLNWEKFPYDPKEIKAVFITHAHIDHIGRLPLLLKAGFNGTIYSTPPTKEIAEIALLDAIGVMEKENKHRAKEKKANPEDLESLYDTEDVSRALRQWKTVGYHEPIMIGDFTVVLRDSGHILGSAMVEFTYGSKKILFTGDLGNSPTPLLKDTEKVTDADYLIMESVYGDRNHEDRQERRNRLEDAIEETIRKDGVVIIPAFSIERTQELLFDIENMMENSRIPLVPVFLDSPMASKVTAVYKKHSDYLNHETNAIIRGGDGIFKFPQFHETLSTEESKAIDLSNPKKIIIAGSGMSNGGRIIHHELKYLPDPNSTVLLAGYQAVGSMGRLIQDGAKYVKILGEEVPVRARVLSVSGYSAHKDSDALFEFVRETADSLKKVFVVMGEPKSSLFLVQRLRDYLGLDAEAPELNQSVEIEL